MLPEFNADGLLPPGDYGLTLDELAESKLVWSEHSPTWDEEWRATLVANLAILVEQLWDVGITEVFIDGSFVEDTDHPNDIDGYFICDEQELCTGRLERKLNLQDPFKVWTWDSASRRPFRGKWQLPMWHKYRVELYPHFGQPSGITDEYGNSLTFPAAFRKSRNNIPRGIIKIERFRD